MTKTRAAEAERTDSLEGEIEVARMVSEALVRGAVNTTSTSIIAWCFRNLLLVTGSQLLFAKALAPDSELF